MGLITIGLAVITTNLDSQFQFQLSNVMGVLAGPILAVFLLGFFTTTANKYGAITGILLSMSTYTKNYGNFILLIFKNELYIFLMFLGMLCGNAFTIWLLMGSLVKTLPKSPSNKLPIYTEGCGKPNSSLYLNVYDVVNNHSQRKETFFYIPEG